MVNRWISCSKNVAGGSFTFGNDCIGRGQANETCNQTISFLDVLSWRKRFNYKRIEKATRWEESSVVLLQEHYFLAPIPILVILLLIFTVYSSNETNVSFISIKDIVWWFLCLKVRIFSNQMALVSVEAIS